MAWGLPLGYLMTFTGLILIGIYIGPGILGSGFDKADSLVPYLATNFAPPIVSAVAMLCLFAFAISKMCIRDRLCTPLQPDRDTA